MAPEWRSPRLPSCLLPIAQAENIITHSTCSLRRHCRSGLRRPLPPPRLPPLPSRPTGEQQTWRCWAAACRHTQQRTCLLSVASAQCSWSTRRRNWRGWRRRAGQTSLSTCQRPRPMPSGGCLGAASTAVSLAISRLALQLLSPPCAAAWPPRLSRCGAASRRPQTAHAACCTCAAAWTWRPCAAAAPPATRWEPCRTHPG